MRIARRLVVLSLLGVLAGCGEKAATGPASREDLLALVPAELNVPAGKDWTASVIAAVQLPAPHGSLESALADPLALPENLRGPAAKSARAEIKRELEMQIRQALEQNQPSRESTEIIVQQFNEYVAATLVLAQIELEDGHIPDALERLGQAASWTKSAIETSHRFAAFDLLPARLMTLEAVRQTADRADVTDADRLKLTELVQPVSHRDAFRAALQAEFTTDTLDRLVTLSREDAVKSSAALLARLNDPIPYEEFLDGLLKPEQRSVDARSAVKAAVGQAKALLAAIDEDWAKIQAALAAPSARLVADLGADPFDWAEDDLKIDKTKPFTSQAKSPLESIALFEVSQIWSPALQSALVADVKEQALQIGLRIRATNAALVGVPKEFRRDPFTGKELSVDLKSRTVRTTLRDPGPDFPFVSGLVQTGVPL